MFLLLWPYRFTLLLALAGPHTHVSALALAVVASSNHQSSLFTSAPVRFWVIIAGLRMHQAPWPVESNRSSRLSIIQQGDLPTFTSIPAYFSCTRTKPWPYCLYVNHENWSEGHLLGILHSEEPTPSLTYYFASPRVTCSLSKTIFESHFVAVVRKCSFGYKPYNT